MSRRLLSLIAVLLVLTGLYGFMRSRRTPHLPQSNVQSFDQTVAHLQDQEESASHAVWAGELEAQRYGHAFEELWDALNRAPNKLELAARWPIETLQLPDWDWDRPQSIAYGIELRPAVRAGACLSMAEWANRLQTLASNGWELVQCEFRHTAFDPPGSNQPARSQFWFSAHALNVRLDQRAIIEGVIAVDWIADSTNSGQLRPSRIDASKLLLKSRIGTPFFKEVLNAEVAPDQGTFFIDPVLVYDLDGDGLPEIILASKNQVYHRQPDGSYQPQTLCDFPPGVIFTAIIADFDGDGFPDLLCAKFEGLVLYKGSPKGTFVEEPRLVWSAPQRLKFVNALTCGDIDGDGHLDVFVAQYKQPYLGGSMPTPYFDANDGYPSFLLKNDGSGNFTDITEAAGLTAKRSRRCYSASMVDLDGDGALDLVQVSDFAGLDLFKNDGHGHFTEVTTGWTQESHAFGMGLAVADFNPDGHLDLFMCGMPSPTVDRLEHAGLWRNEKGEERLMRSRMSFGNRLYLAREPASGFVETELGNTVARSGWSWGCTAADFDNDGFPDLYIANGHESKQTVADYDSEFWLHDIYVSSSEPNEIAAEYFNRVGARTRGRGYSYGGYDKNRLFLNLGGTNFTDCAFLAGTALEADSRNVVGADIDGDGRPDLVVTTFEVWPRLKQTLKIFRNEIPSTNNWIGFRLREAGPGKSPVGVRALLRCGRNTQTRAVVVGDSYRSQHPAVLHFGIGTAPKVDRVEFFWPGGKTLHLDNPAINQFHSISAP